MKEITIQCFSNADYGISRGAFCTFLHVNASSGLCQLCRRTWCIRESKPQHSPFLMDFCSGNCTIGHTDGTLQAKSSGHRKRGRRGGLHQRLKTLRLDNCRKLPPLPSVLLSNVQSIRNKLDELETYAKFKREVKDTCLLAFTETWLGDANPDLDLNLTGFGSPIRMDRSSEITGKNQGGGVCFFYTVYIHPRPNATVASQLIADVTHKLDSICPESPKFILGDFNHCNL